MKLTFNKTLKLPGTATFVQLSGGVQYNFDRPVKVGTFATGQPYAIADQDFAITSVTPDSGDLAGDGFIGNGLMRDPYINSLNGNVLAQGFDEYFRLSPAGASVVGWDASLNLDPATNGSILVTKGDEYTLVKTVRHPDLAKVGTDVNQWQTVSTYAPLTILAAEPPANAFMPTMTGLNKKLYTTADVNLSAFRSLSFPVSFPDLATIESKIPEYMGVFGTTNNEKVRRFRLDADLGTSAGNYSAALAPYYARANLVLHSSTYTDQEKQSLLYKLITWAIHMEGCVERGWVSGGAWGIGAGQNGAKINTFYTGAFALNSPSMINSINMMRDATDQGENTSLENTRWLTEEYLGMIPGTDTGSHGNAFASEVVGMPDMKNTEDADNTLKGRYGPIGDAIQRWDATPIILLQNGPSGETGFSAVNRGTFGVGNDDSATWAYLDRLYTITPYPDGTWAPTQEWYDIWSNVRSLGIYTHWTGQPERFHNDLPSRFIAGDGSISWDVTDHDYATETITSTDFRYSLDGVQYIEQLNAGRSGTVTGLLKNVQHFLGLRHTSASGTSQWSQNWSDHHDLSTLVLDPPINTRTTTGTPTATVPSFTTSPAICQKIWPEMDRMIVSPDTIWHGNYEIAPTTLGKEVVSLAAGVGYVDGEAEPSFSYQWYRDGSPLTSTQEYTIQPGVDSGATLTCEITPSNSAGSGTASTTTAVTVFNHPLYRADNDLFSVSGSSAGGVTGANIGDPDADRWVAVVLTGKRYNDNSIPTTVTVGGVNCSLVSQGNDPTINFGPFSQIWISDSKIPSGTTADIFFDGWLNGWHLEAVPIYASSLAAHATASATFTPENPATVPIAIPSNGVLLVSGASEDTNAQEDIKIDRPGSPIFVDRVARFQFRSGTNQGGAWRFGIEYFDSADASYDVLVKNDNAGEPATIAMASFSLAERA